MEFLSAILEKLLADPEIGVVSLVFIACIVLLILDRREMKRDLKDERSYNRKMLVENLNTQANMTLVLEGIKTAISNRTGQQ